MKKTAGLILTFVLILQAFFLAGCKKATNEWKDYSFESFDTSTIIIGYEDEESVFKENCKKIKAELLKYHKLFTIYSRYDGINNLSTVNDVVNCKHNTVKVDNEIIKLLEFSKEMYNKTNGGVNVAMGSVLKIWHQYRNAGNENPQSASLPNEILLKNAAKHTDITKIIIDNKAGTVFLDDSEMYLDVGAIAKGYAVEKVALWMEKEGMEGYLLNVGGNIKIVGKRPYGKKWKIGIENPMAGEDDYAEYLNLGDNLALATSGIYQRYYVVDGKQYHHIIDPKSLMPAEKFKSVSVLCKNSAMADALSTALFTMSLEDGKKLINSLENTEAFWIMSNGEKEYSENFKKYK